LSLSISSQWRGNSFHVGSNSTPPNRYSGRRKKPRLPSLAYHAYLHILNRDPTDYELVRLRRNLISCATYQLATTGVIGTNRFGYPHQRCEQPECFSCRYTRKGKESRKFSLGAHPLFWCIDRLEISRQCVAIPAILPQLSFSFLTINLWAYPLDAMPDEIVHARIECRKLIRDTIRKAQAKFGNGSIALFGHLEASPPISGSDLDRYLIRDADPDKLYSVVHFHGWIAATESRENTREILVDILGDRSAQKRRVCLRERHQETQDFSVSISEVLDYGIKHLHSIKNERDNGSEDILFLLSRFRKYLRGDGLKGTRIGVNLKAMERTADALWAAHRQEIYTEFEKIEQYGMLARMPKSLHDDYRSWKTIKSLRPQNKTTSEWLICYNNWCHLSLAKILITASYYFNGTGFERLYHLHLGFWSRAPPWSFSFVSG